MALARSRGERGSFLVQAMLLVLLMSFLAARYGQTTMTRALVAGNAPLDGERTAALESARALVYSCLARSSLGQAGCDDSPWRTCYPREVGGYALEVEVGGAAPFCAVTMSLSR